MCEEVNVETRVQKHKEYRDEIMSEADIFSSSQHMFSKENKIRNTSTILPMDQVIEKLVIDENEIKRQKRAKRNRVLKIILIILGITCFLALVTLIGILLW